MRLLFVHQNFPGQYRHLAACYGARRGNQVLAVGEKANLLRQRPQLPGVQLLGYDMPPPAPGSKAHAPVLNAIDRGRRVASGALRLRKAGFRPDVVFAHLGWGEALFLKDVFPEAKLLLYCEFFYRARGSDVGFDAEFCGRGLEPLARLRVMNAPLLMALDAADWRVSPTRWQRAQLPAGYAARTSVLHDGVDTDAVTPDPHARFHVPGTGLVLTRADEVITYATRNLEPYRGFHVFMRALPALQRRRPSARIVIAGADEVSYSPRLPPGETYRARLLRELEGRIDLSRVHFVGKLPFEQYLQLLRVSSAHVYLTYPFVLSWSLVEALAAGCVVIASRTAPVEEAIQDADNGLLVDFFDREGLAERIDEALSNREAMARLRKRARQSAIARYDLKRICLPAQTQLVARLASSRPGGLELLHERETVQA